MLPILQVGDTGNSVRAKAKVYPSMYRHYFEEDDTMLCIKKDQKQKLFLSINGLSTPTGANTSGNSLLGAENIKTIKY